MKCSLLICCLAIVLTAVITQSAHAGLLGAGLGGALKGAIVGDLVDGRKGAKIGAIIGGLIGASEAASRNKRQKQQQAEAERRRAAWAAQEQAEQALIREQQTAASAADRTLMVETQKSLIRLGFSPGDIGTESPALRDAVKEYQGSKGLLETGKLSQELLTHMLRNGG